jgi:hypothetical protein
MPFNKSVNRRLRYLSNPLPPAFSLIDIPKCELINKTCPECDYPIAWDKQNAGIFVNCSMCFHLHPCSKVIACMATIADIKLLKVDKSKLETALEYCRGRDKIHYVSWESLPIDDLKTLLGKMQND